MEGAFLNHLFSTRRIVSMTKLTQTTQLEDEPVVTLNDGGRCVFNAKITYLKHLL